MKNRRLLLVNHTKDPAANGGGFNFLLGNSSENLSFASPFSGVRLADNSNNSSMGINSPVGIIVIVLISVLCFMACFSTCLCKSNNEDEWLRGSRRGSRRGNDEGNSGLDRAVIESFPVFSYDLVKALKAQTNETLECAVCLREFEDDEQLRLLPKCSHAFHPDCIDEWLFSHTTCPICRTSLVPTDEGNPTGTCHGIVEPREMAPPYEVAVVVNGASNGSVHGDNDIEIAVAAESSDSQESLGMLGVDEGKKFRRSYSTGHSLVRLRKDIDQLATEWYICTAEGLISGLHRNCSVTTLSHPRSQGSSTSETRPALSKQASMHGSSKTTREDDQLDEDSDSVDNGSKKGVDDDDTLDEDGDGFKEDDVGGGSQ